MKQNTRDKIEEWIKKCLKEVLINDITVTPDFTNCYLIGERSPKLVSKGYSIDISLKTRNYEDN